MAMTVCENDDNDYDDGNNNKEEEEKDKEYRIGATVHLCTVLQLHR